MGDPKEIVQQFLNYIGEDLAREGLADTPKRVVKSWGELFSGYSQDPSSIFTSFDNKRSFNEMIVLKNIEFYSTCEHHLLPFFGRATIGYVPSKKIIGISKLARLLDIFARRLQIQERIGDQVTETLMEHLKPKGAACIIEAQHFCMTARGVNKQNSVMVTSSLKGGFLKDGVAREEMMQIFNQGRL